MKIPGRLGHSTHVGGAIWAEQREHLSIAVALSGSGEMIARNILAYKIASSLFKRQVSFLI